MNFDNVKYLFQLPLEWFKGINDRVYKMFGTNFLTVREDQDGGTELGVDEDAFAQMVQQYAPPPGPQPGEYVTSVNGIPPGPGGNVQLSGMVWAVNGQGPDEIGNVELSDVVYSVNGQPPDANGDVSLSDVVYSVNGETPDEDGDVDLGDIVYSVNGSTPDENGNVTIATGTGTVQAVNGVAPDVNGNVILGDIVHTVNGQSPDQYGDLTLTGMVESVNGVQPGQNGDVDLGDIVASVNGESPDQNGNVELTGLVQTVNGEAPDSNGNVSLTGVVYSVNGSAPDGNGDVDLGDIVYSVNGEAADANGEVWLTGLVYSVDNRIPGASGDVDFGLDGGKWMKTDSNGHLAVTDEIPVALSAGNTGYLYSNDGTLQFKNESYVDLSSDQTVRGDKTWKDDARFYSAATVTNEDANGYIIAATDGQTGAADVMIRGGMNGAATVTMFSTGSQQGAFLVKKATGGLRIVDQGRITLASTVNCVQLSVSPDQSAPDEAVATVGWCKDTLLSGYTNSTGLDLVTDVTWNGTTLQKKTRNFKFKNGLVTSVGSETTATIDTPVAY